MLDCPVEMRLNFCQQGVANQGGVCSHRCDLERYGLRFPRRHADVAAWLNTRIIWTSLYKHELLKFNCSCSLHFPRNAIKTMPPSTGLKILCFGRFHCCLMILRSHCQSDRWRRSQRAEQPVDPRLNHQECRIRRRWRRGKSWWYLALQIFRCHYRDWNRRVYWPAWYHCENILNFWHRILALLLGRFKLTIPECLVEYRRLSSHILEDESPASPLFKTSKLIEAAKETVERYSKDDPYLQSTKGTNTAKT